MTSSIGFEKTFKYPLIYIFSINDEAHKNRLKIGQTTISTNKTSEQLTENCDDLKEAAKKRIDTYTKTADIPYTLLHAQLAITTNRKKCKSKYSFKDHDVHRILTNSYFHRKSMGSAKEWFEVNLEEAKSAIEAAKNCENNISGGTSSDGYTPITFRPEQIDAIEKTVKRFEKHKRMLWNAKMRFGKTLAALEVIKREQFKKSIIITHRPVVDKSWYDDFNKIFLDIDGYKYGSKGTGYDSLKDLINSGKNFVYFASIQDLRGSTTVGGTFDKNDEIFNLDWDLVIIDEAHEGTRTELGQSVYDALIKDNTKRLELSGTPFNIKDEYEDDEVYTWDYIMEQEAKENWDIEHFGDSNPYEELPKMHIFTYDLGELLNTEQYNDIIDKAFNFKEFFRTWTGDIEKDSKNVPPDKIGDFVYEKDVINFLNLISHENENNNYPFASKKYRDLFKHTFWLLPGVAEAKALSKLLRDHPVFSAFEIVNVAGDGDDEDPNDEALNMVKTAINNAGEDGYTITLSCGKLTTGVTVKEWTAVMYLSGSNLVSASNYLQTIFRAQSPCNKYGKIKTDCYVFDFAPDRTLKVIADAVQLSTKAGESTDEQRYALKQFINFCPVISIDNTGMKPYNVPKMLQQLKRAYADKAVANGFNHPNLYNYKLMTLTKMDLDDFNELKNAVATSTTNSSIKNVEMNNTGLTDEQWKKVGQTKQKPEKERTSEEKAILEEYEELKKQKKDAISILNEISIRMPLLIFGADIPFNQDFKLSDFLNEDIVDQKSWKEFMPEKVTKEIFEKFIKYYDEEVFVAAGNKIRRTIKDADNLPIEERIKKITELHSYFKNPDKETVLTPWRVVNMHLSDCFGGWCFYDDTFDFVDGLLEEPRHVSRGYITSEVFNEKSQILEINSKTGLYQLYMAYNIYKNKADSYSMGLSIDDQWKNWLEIIEGNVFIISKTPMANAIARRTLLGFSKTQFNACYFEDMLNQFENNDEELINKISDPAFWNIKGDDKMKFDAIVGNPPYQEMDGGANASAKNVFQYFVNVSKKLKPNYISLIIPAKWYTSGKKLDDFRKKMLDDKHIIKLFDYVNSKDIFPSVEIKGGICYFLRSENEERPCEIEYHNNGEIQKSIRYLQDLGGIYIRDERIISILHKIMDNDFESFGSIVSSRQPYGLTGDFFKNPKNYDLPEIFDEKNDSTDLSIFGLENRQRIFKYIPQNYPLPKKEGLYKYKLFVNRTYGNGKLGQDNRPTPVIGKPKELCTETFLQVGPFESEIEAQNALKYMETKLFKLLVGVNKITQDASKKVYNFVPIQDFSENSDIDWNNSVSEQLYEKYNLDSEEQKFVEELIVR